MCSATQLAGVSCDFVGAVLGTVSWLRTLEIHIEHAGNAGVSSNWRFRDKIGAGDCVMKAILIVVQSDSEHSEAKVLVEKLMGSVILENLRA